MVFPFFSFRFLCIVTLILASVVSVADVTISGAGGDVRVTVTAQGHYKIEKLSNSWTFEGSVSAPVNPIESDAADALGFYSQIIFSNYRIRTYKNSPVVMFSMKANGDKASEVRFPVFTKYPREFHTLSYKHHVFAPAVFDLSGDAPWVLFDDNARAAILSPASHFMISNNFRGSDGTISSGIEPQVAGNVSSFQYESVLVFGEGVNRAFETWGAFLLSQSAKQRPANDASASLAKLGYWTDNGATYYYNFDKKLGYAGTIEAVQKEFEKKGFPLGHVQLDSWWYDKGFSSDCSAKDQAVCGPSWMNGNYGVYAFDGAKDLFPQGVAGLHGRLGVPLVVHSRWIDPSSPYFSRFKFSGFVATSPEFWNEAMAQLRSYGVETYEQDWLNEKALPKLDNISDADLFLDNMARAAAQNGMNLQYCMPFARHYLQGSKYSNLHSIRASYDGFDRRWWDNFIFDSRLASAVGIWPWTDIVYSHDRSNLLISVLSAGIVGVGDRLAANQNDWNPDWCRKHQNCPGIDVENLRQAVRADGVIVKPDTSLVPLDSSYLRHANSKTGVEVAQDRAPTIASARSYSDDGKLVAAYIFGYAPINTPDVVEAVDLRETGITGDAYVYDYFARKGHVVRRGEKDFLKFTAGGSYYVTVPLIKGASSVTGGSAMIGDVSKFATLGRQRFRIVKMDDRGADLMATLTSDENDVTLTGFAMAANGNLSKSGLWTKKIKRPLAGRLSRRTITVPFHVSW